MRAVTVLAVASLLAAGSATAMFRAADLVIVPVAAATVGLENSDWRSDIEILNVDTVAIDVEIVLLPSNSSSNTYWYMNMENHLGGRESDGFGHVDERLKDIQPGRVVILEDLVRAVWEEGNKGALLIFAFEAGTFSTTDPPGGTPRKIVVTSRTYSQSTTGEGDTARTLTYGQQIPGLPWYDYIDPNLKDEGLSSVTFTGIREDDRFRTALGLVNVSDILTGIEVKMTLKAADGTVLKERSLLLGPLVHVQYDQFVTVLLGLDDEQEYTGLTVTVEATAWQGTADEPTPALIAYVSRVDNATNDPVYLEQTFANELPWDCVFNGNCSAASLRALSSAGRPRPLRPPVPASLR
jgi:hypothetical protein